ncbi:TolC family protein [Ekhidna sp.]|uniref:TolC family protein n=1 Tax=Ekhidna sp. TaxID=2608089 RepID=UPI003CCBEBBF
MRKLIFSIGILCLSLSYGQEQLSLSDAIQIGLQRNYGILIEEGNVEVARNNNDWGQAGRWPTISLSVNQNNNLTDNVKVAFPTATQGQTLSNSLNPTLNVNWTLFDGFRANITKKRLELLQAESQGNASVVIANTLQSIILGYYLAVLEYERLNEFEKQLALSRDKYQYIKIKSDLGSAVTTDILLEEGNYLTDSINYINQQLTYRNAIRDLNVLLAEENVAKTYVFMDTLQLPDETYTFDDLRSQMIQKNVDLKKQYITQSLLGEATKLSNADRYPTLALNASFSENRNSLDLSEAVFFTGSGFSGGPDTRLNSVTDNYTASFTLSYTLFDGGRINRAIKNAMVNERVGQLRVDQMETSLDRDLLSALDRYNVRRQLFAINSRREEAAKTNLDLSEEKFKNGSINSFDYRDVQNNYLSSSILKLQAAYNLINSKIELMRLTGGLIRAYKD